MSRRLVQLLFDFVPSQGAFLPAIFTHSGWLQHLSEQLQHRGWQTLLWFPLFLASLALLVGGVGTLMSARRAPEPHGERQAAATPAGS